MEVLRVADRGKRKSPIRELLETIVAALLVTLVVRTFVVEIYRVEGSSMADTLHSAERVVVNKFLYRWVRQPQPGDIVVFQYPREPDRDFIKRVVAVAGDKVEIKAGKVYVNGELLPEAPAARINDEDRLPTVVPENSVWVLGDNRNNSEDSRYFGQVPLENIRGMAFFRIWPLARVCRFVNPVSQPDIAAWGGLACH